MSIVFSFIFGGLLCAFGELLICRTKLTPSRILVGYVCTGVFLSAFGIFDRIAEIASEGVYLPLVGFGNLLAKGVEREINQSGWIGILTGGLKAASGGITLCIVLSVLICLFVKPHAKK